MLPNSTVDHSTSLILFLLMLSEIHSMNDISWFSCWFLHSYFRPPYSPRSSNFSIQLLNTWSTNYLFVPFDVPGPRQKNKSTGATPGKQSAIA